MTREFVVTTRLPHSGLGNMLLVWARAIVFAHINSFPMVAPNWINFHIGPWLRKERVKRYYGSFFRTKDYKSQFSYLLSTFGSSKHVHANPKIDKLDLTSAKFSSPGQHIFSFDKMPPWNHYFQGLEIYQSLVKQKLYADIRPYLLKEIMALPAPQIGIHIRRGDYQQPQSENDFAVNRNVYTDIQWYINTLKAIRQIAQTDIHATVFSDGYPEELEEILSLPNVCISKETSALSDMITMSRSKILIGSAHSSFSAWASYLGQCPTLWSADRFHLYEPIFTNESRQYVYEGGFDPLTNVIPELLKKNILELFITDTK